jgi:hypothetical protein
MPNRLFVLLLILLLPLLHAGTAVAQEVDLSHPLFQEETRSWDYGLLMECGIKYDITVGIYKSLAADTSDHATAIARWEHAHLLFDGLADSAAKSQGLSDEKIAGERDFKKEVLTEPVIAAGEDKKALADVAVSYMQYAKNICTPYFEELKTRMEYIEGHISR